MNTTPPSPAPSASRSSLSPLRKMLLGVAVIFILLFGLLVILRLFGLVRPFSIPTSAMAPALQTGDHVLMEGITFLIRSPRRGDIVVFRTDNISGVPQSQYYVKRVAGEPGDHLRIEDGRLHVNDRHVLLTNEAGEIVYQARPETTPRLPGPTGLAIGSGEYFVLGDNSTNSFDSRFWGTVPRPNIKGRIVFRYWPPTRIGCPQ